MLLAKITGHGSLHGLTSEVLNESDYDTGISASPSGGLGLVSYSSVELLCSESMLSTICGRCSMVGEPADADCAGAGVIVFGRQDTTVVAAALDFLRLNKLSCEASNTLARLASLFRGAGWVLRSPETSAAQSTPRDERWLATLTLCGRAYDGSDGRCPKASDEGATRFVARVRALPSVLAL